MKSNQELMAQVAPYTMVDRGRLEAVIRALDATQHLHGAFVECGTWRGGVCMLAGMHMLQAGSTRPMVLFDTFTGMPKPTEEDGPEVAAMWQPGWCAGDLEDVRQNVTSVYPEEKCTFVQGMVEDTIPTFPAFPISVLRLDTDWYSSTKIELEHLYPMLQPGGAILIDDYGHWSGCRKAVDEYFNANPPTPVFTFDDYTGISGFKAETSNGKSLV